MEWQLCFIRYRTNWKLSKTNVNITGKDLKGIEILKSESIKVLPENHLGRTKRHVRRRKRQTAKTGRTKYRKGHTVGNSRVSGPVQAWNSHKEHKRNAKGNELLVITERTGNHIQERKEKVTRFHEGTHSGELTGWRTIWDINISLTLSRSDVDFIITYFKLFNSIYFFNFISI